MPTVPYTKTTLSNGLHVIVHADRDVPIVAVNVWYHVGSKNERRGRTGFAHLFEHLMFEGSAHQDHSYFEPLQEAGGSLNGSTSADRTNYWEVVPTNALDLALWMEADRMGFLLPALTDEKFENQRSVVINERRQNYENRPYGLAGFALLAALFPYDHPYSWSTIGETADLVAADPDDVRAFFATYYHPGNASLAIAGDIDPDDALRRAERYFADLPAGPRVSPVSSPLEAPLVGQRLLLEDRVEMPRLYMAWRSPAMFAAGDAERDLLADILANGKTSRLYRQLVHERRVALDVSAGQGSREIAGFFQLASTAAPGVPLAVLEDAVRAELTNLATSGPTANELERARAQAEAHFTYRLQSVGGFGGKSDQLNAYQTYLGSPDGFDRDLQRYLAVSEEAVAEAARQCHATPCVALSVVPRGKSELALAGSSPAVVS